MIKLLWKVLSRRRRSANCKEASEGTTGGNGDRMPPLCDWTVLAAACTPDEGRDEHGNALADVAVGVRAVFDGTQLSEEVFADAAGA